MKKIIPAIGILLFFCIYFLAATLYPGGTQTDATTVGFSWFHNYWCDLLETVAYNGMNNPAMPMALGAMLMLCFSLALFFYRFPKYFPLSSFWNRTIRVCGILSMVCTMLVASPLHNIMIGIASLLGLFALLGIIYGVIHYKMRVFTLIAILCLLLIGFSNYSYYSRDYVYWLPLVQKITFAVVLIWLLFLNLEFRKVEKLEIQ